MSFTYVQIIDFLRLSKNYQRLIPFSIFIGYPLLSFALEFEQLIFTLVMGIASASFAAILSYRSFENQALPVSKKIALACFALLLLSFSISIYQSLIFYFIILILAKLLFTQEDRLVKYFAGIAAFVLTSLGVYYLILFAFLYFFKLELTYIDQFIDISKILHDPAGVLRMFVFEVAETELGFESRFGTSLCFSGVLFLGLLARIFESFRQEFSWKVLVLIPLIVILPYSMSLLFGSGMPLRSLVSVPLGLAVLLEFTLSTRFRLLKIASLISGTVLFLQIIKTLSHYNAINQFRLHHDREMAHQVYQAIVRANPGFNRDSTYQVDFFRFKEIPLSAYTAPNSSTINGSFFQWDNGNPDRIVYFMKLHGYDNFVTLSAEKRLLVKPYYEDMNVWPDVNSVKRIGDVTLIKLGK